jgi:hypothetical protein
LKGGVIMKFKTLMLIKAIVCLALGIPVLLMPRFLYGLFGVNLDAAGVYPAWEYGASLIGNCLLTWFARYARESKGRRALIKGMTFYNGIGVIITLIAVLTGVMNLFGLGIIVIYLFFTLGFGYFWIKPPVP